MPSTFVWEMPTTRQNQQVRAGFTLRKVKSLRKWTIRPATLIRKGFYLANKLHSCKRPGNQDAMTQKVTQNQSVPPRRCKDSQRSRCCGSRRRNNSNASRKRKLFSVPRRRRNSRRKRTRVASRKNTRNFSLSWKPFVLKQQQKRVTESDESNS